MVVLAVSVRASPNISPRKAQLSSSTAVAREKRNELRLRFAKEAVKPLSPPAI